MHGDWGAGRPRCRHRTMQKTRHPHRDHSFGGRRLAEATPPARTIPAPASGDCRRRAREPMAPSRKPEAPSDTRRHVPTHQPTSPTSDDGIRAPRGARERTRNVSPGASHRAIDWRRRDRDLSIPKFGRTQTATGPCPGGNPVRRGARYGVGRHERRRDARELSP